MIKMEILKLGVAIKTFYFKDTSEANAAVQAELVGHPEVYPPELCSYTISDATAERAAKDAEFLATKEKADAEKNDKKQAIDQLMALKKSDLKDADAVASALLKLIKHVGG